MIGLLPTAFQEHTKKKQVDVPTHVDGAGCLRDELALRIMRKITPGLTYSQAWKALTHGYLRDNPEATASVDMDPDLLLEVISMAEAKDIKHFLGEMKVASTRFAEVKTARRQQIPKYFAKGKPAAAAAEKPKAKAKPKPKAKAVAAAAEKTKVPHWKPPANALAADATLYIKKSAPPEGDIVQDDYNGRWRCFYPERDPKSVSWTKRGLHPAANVCLHQLWTWHEEATGMPAPFDITELLKVPKK